MTSPAYKLFVGEANTILTLLMKVRAYITHKQSEHYSDCQDRFCINEANKTLAVSDGMSQSIFPEYWAEILSMQYAKTGHCSEEDRISLCADWMKKVEDYLHEQESQGKNPWRLKNNIAARSGAGATICGIQFKNAKDWTGDVLGDSCIIEISKKDWKAKILSSEKKAFDSHPDFYDSFQEKKGCGKIQQFNGSLSYDNILLLVSDPFSEYFDKHKDNCKDLAEQVLSLKSHEDFCKLVSEWRDKGMHNDDSTLCIVEFDGKCEFDIQTQDNIQELIEAENHENLELSEPLTIEPPTEEINSVETKADRNNATIYQYHTVVIEEIDRILQNAKGTNQHGYKKNKKTREKGIDKKIKVKIIERLKNNISNYFNKIIKEC